MPSRRKETNRLRKERSLMQTPTQKFDLPIRSMEESERLRKECFKRAWDQKASREAKITKLSKPDPDDDDFCDD